MQRPPPLQLLPAFEAASRLLSFSKAAAELHVTTAAVSQQIRQLESYLGLPLFLRLTRRVELTDAGRQFAELVSRMLQQYRQGHADLLHHHTRPVLRLSMTPLVAQELLIPRLAAFQAQHPDVSIRLDARMDFVDFEREPIDAAIRVGKGPWPGLQAQPLCRCVAAIVASPQLLARQPVHSIDDLARHTLIHPREAPGTGALPPTSWAATSCPGGPTWCWTPTCQRSRRPNKAWDWRCACCLRPRKCRPA